jgi:hypothetical protein
MIFRVKCRDSSVTPAVADPRTCTAPVHQGHDHVCRGRRAPSDRRYAGLDHQDHRPGGGGVTSAGAGMSWRAGRSPLLGAQSRNGPSSPQRIGRKWYRRGSQSSMPRAWTAACSQPYQRAVRMVTASSSFHHCLHQRQRPVAHAGHQLRRDVPPLLVRQDPVVRVVAQRRVPHRLRRRVPGRPHRLLQQLHQPAKVQPSAVPDRRLQQGQIARAVPGRHDARIDVFVAFARPMQVAQQAADPGAAFVDPRDHRSRRCSSSLRSSRLRTARVHNAVA